MLMNVLVIGSCFAQKWDPVGLQSTYIVFLFLFLYLMGSNNETKSAEL